jgi:hypothetical protein
MQCLQVHNNNDKTEQSENAYAFQGVSLYRYINREDSLTLPMMGEAQCKDEAGAIKSKKRQTLWKIQNLAQGVTKSIPSQD